jgi:hypothetical protein
MRTVGIAGQGRVVVGPLMEAALRRMTQVQWLTVKELAAITKCVPKSANYALTRCVLFGFAVRFREPKGKGSGSHPFRYRITDAGYRYLEKGLNPYHREKVLRKRKQVFGSDLSPKRSGLPKARPVEEEFVK